MAATTQIETDFPYSLYIHLSCIGRNVLANATARRVISIPLPTNRLASAAMQAIQVDKELSPLVHRSFALKSPDASGDDADESKTVLETTYRATTNRMLRVSVNGFMDTLGVVLGVIEELDVDVLSEELK